ncbi:MAG: 4Fe-4S binding protein [Candidatus Marinimicrobia bacterium]|nr:4Fe-4S binding protein [Candidatus Neomarinimicrobiota bacterium]
MIQVREEYCPQNHRCPVISRCPIGAISQNGYSAPIIDQEKCTDCGICTRSCGVFRSAE